MLSGVLFRRLEDGSAQPEFVNAFVLTDIYLSSLTSSQIVTPINPSITTLMNPKSSIFRVVQRIMRATALVLISHFPTSAQVVKKISVANTGILWHDGRALATCESGPPIRVTLPDLKTVGWYNGNTSEGEKEVPIEEDDDVVKESGQNFGGEGVLSWIREWTTAHPKVDFDTGDLISFHSSFIPPYIHYSIVPPTFEEFARPVDIPSKPIYNAAVAGITSPKMTHDFGVSKNHTVILDLPLSLNPMNIYKGPVVSFDPQGVSRFGIFPRWQPESVRWYQEDAACCIFHVANTWDEQNDQGRPVLNMLSCRLNSATLVFSAGNIAPPQQITLEEKEEEVCQLYYHQFDVSEGSSEITHSFPLTAIPFEFPQVSKQSSMNSARYIYGCSLYADNFSLALGRASKIDCLAKVDVQTLITRGQERQKSASPGTNFNKLPVDLRTVEEIVNATGTAVQSPDPIQIFRFPEGFYAQEVFFVSSHPAADEGDGYIMTYVFNETEGIDPVTKQAKADSKSELWIIDAKNMKDVVCKITLPQRGKPIFSPFFLHVDIKECFFEPMFSLGLTFVFSAIWFTRHLLL